MIFAIKYKDTRLFVATEVPHGRASNYIEILKLLGMDKRHDIFDAMSSAESKQVAERLVKATHERGGCQISCGS